MARTSLAAFDGTARGAEAVALARMLARAHGSRVLIVHVEPPRTPWDGVGGPGADPVRAAHDRAHAAARDLTEPGDPTPRIVVAASPARGLQELAEQESADLVVLGRSHRSPLGRAVLGTTARRLLEGAPCPVAIAPENYATRDLRIVGVAFDGSPEAREAIRYASDLAVDVAASVRVIVAVESATEDATPGLRTPVNAEAMETARQHARDGARGVAPDVSVQTTVCPGHPASAIMAVCEEDVDLLVCGSRGYGPSRAVLIGSVSEPLIAHAPCPVVVVPRTATAHDPARDTAPFVTLADERASPGGL